MIDISLTGLTVVIGLSIGVWTWNPIKVVEHLISELTPNKNPTRRTK